MEASLEIINLHVNVGDKPILKGVTLTIRPGEIHALMGPNGSGKSTLSYALMGHPRYTITQGEVRLNGENLLELSPDERARRGLFLAMQYPTVVPGVTLYNFLHAAVSSMRGYTQAARTGGSSGPGRLNAHLMPAREFRQEVLERMAQLKMDQAFLRRYLNEGFSGGEKKRAEILQMALLKPRYAILDETDSGLDIDALRIVSEGVNALYRELNLGLLVITHYQRLLNYIQPQFVHIFYQGRIFQSGDYRLVALLEERGYDWIAAQAERQG